MREGDEREREREMRERRRMGELEVPETAFLSLGQFNNPSCVWCVCHS